jgi:hypothetical protein
VPRHCPTAAANARVSTRCPKYGPTSCFRVASRRHRRLDVVPKRHGSGTAAKTSTLLRGMLPSSTRLACVRTIAPPARAETSARQPKPPARIVPTGSRRVCRRHATPMTTWSAANRLSRRHPTTTGFRALSPTGTRSRRGQAKVWSSHRRLNPVTISRTVRHFSNPPGLTPTSTHC